MENIRMTCSGAEIMFRTNSQNMANYFLTDKEQVPETIPDIKTEKVAEEIFDRAKPFLEYIDSELLRAEINPIKNQATISCPENKLYVPDLIYLALSMFAKELNKQNKYFIHSAVVEKDGKAIVLSGEPGSGKTTLALQFCMKDGYKFVANDRVVIGKEEGKCKVFAGTMQTHVRLGVLHEYFPQLVSKVDPEKMAQPWQNKIYINPEFEDLGIQTTQQAEVDKIMYVQTYPVDDKQTQISELPADVATLANMKAMSDYIRAGRNVVISTGDPFPSFDDKKLARMRMDFVHDLVKNAKTYDARGSINGIVDMVKEL
jgi:hypothetical protein